MSGPLRDRIDLWVSVDRVPAALLVAAARPEGSAPVAARIAQARDRQRRRGEANGRLRGRALRATCRLRPDTRRRVVMLAEREWMSARGTDRLLRVARTIADLEGADGVARHHLDEAARFRAPVDRMMLGVAG